MATTRRVDGPTPNGGSYTLIYFLDDERELVDEQEATQAEVVEYNDEDEQVFRTYAEIVSPQISSKSG